MPTKQSNSPSSSPRFKLKDLLHSFVLDSSNPAQCDQSTPEAEWAIYPSPGPAQLIEHGVVDIFFKNFQLEVYKDPATGERELVCLDDLNTEQVHAALESMKWTVAIMCDVMDIATRWEQLMIVPVEEEGQEV